MHLFKNALVFVILFFPHGRFEFMIPKRGENYGPYDLQLVDYGLCPGVQLHRTQVMAYSEQDAHGKYVTVTNITYANNTRLNSVKVFVYRRNEDSKPLWKYMLKKPCEHPISGLIFFKSYGTDSRCIVNKGQYIIKMQVDELVPASFLGDEFFYGQFTYKVTASAKNFVVFCVMTKCMFTKKDVKNKS